MCEQTSLSLQSLDVSPCDRAQGCFTTAQRCCFSHIILLNPVVVSTCYIRRNTPTHTHTQTDTLFSVAIVFVSGVSHVEQKKFTLLSRPDLVCLSSVNNFVCSVQCIHMHSVFNRGLPLRLILLKN